MKSLRHNNYYYSSDTGMMSYMTWEELEAEFSGMYNRIETNDEGDITMRQVVEHIKGVEAGSGNNTWVSLTI